MKIVNKTIWRTDQLRAIIARCAAMEFDDARGSRRPDGKLRPGRKHLNIVVAYTRRGGCTGYAFYHSTHSVVRIANPRGLWQVEKSPPMTEASASLKRMFAMVVCHEFAHNRGMKHRGMPGYYNWGARDEKTGEWNARYDWVESMPLEVKKAPPKPTADETRDRRHTHAVRMLALADTRVKRATTIRRKWAKKVQYYVRAAAAAKARTT